MRSFSLQGRMGGADLQDQARLGVPETTWVQGAGFPQFKKHADIKGPGPSRALVFIDENPYTIDDGYFAIPVFRGNAKANYFQNSPAARHNNGGVLSFADGHAELWKWLEPTTARIKTLDYRSPKGANDRDLMRLHDVIATRE